MHILRGRIKPNNFSLYNKKKQAFRMCFQMMATKNFSNSFRFREFVHLFLCSCSLQHLTRIRFLIEFFQNHRISYFIIHEKCRIVVHFEWVRCSEWNTERNSCWTVRWMWNALQSVTALQLLMLSSNSTNHISVTIFKTLWDMTFLLFECGMKTGDMFNLNVLMIMMRL